MFINWQRQERNDFTGSIFNFKNLNDSDTIISIIYVNLRELQSNKVTKLPKIYLFSQQTVSGQDWRLIARSYNGNIGLRVARLQ